MGLESGTYIDDLVVTNPVGSTDTKSTLDDHIRLLKSTIKNSFPNITGAATFTQSEANVLAGVTAGTAAASKALVVDANKDIDLDTGDLTATDVNATNVTVTGAFTSQGIDDNANQTAITIGSDESVTIEIPTSADALTVNATSGQYAVTLNGSSTVGQSFGQIIKAGTDSSDWALAIQEYSGTTTYMRVFGDGGVTLGNPTGGNPNAVGYINAKQYQVDGNQVYYATGTDVAVADGGTGSSTAAGARSNLGIDGSTGVIQEGDIDWTNSDGISQACLLESTVSGGNISMTTKDNAPIYIPANVNLIEYVCEMSVSAGTGGFQLVIGADIGDTINSTSTSYEWKLTSNARLDVSAYSGWNNIAIQLNNTGGTTNVRRIRYRFL